MANRPKEVEARLEQVLEAWENLRPTKSFAKMTLDEFKARVKPSQEARTKIKELEDQMTAAINRRNDADDATLEVVQLVVNAVKGDPDEGEDGDLIDAMGYVRKSERASGLKRSRPATQPVK
jgi:hypothetical protein